ncbi:hypothetical protein I551_5750 [Mycobacterium ulcerans str. Harvey]|uniref:Uncharacterized protein n=1 Tax=Mycobacterium ulcerans str. Harvey TaxID=1299332 RepID=A0ABP3ADK7_MYCUL|nr:hypothetical protein I551_5750 [Mycobacterium ulcerans str. Harvey]
MTSVRAGDRGAWRRADPSPAMRLSRSRWPVRRPDNGPAVRA